MTQVGLEGVVVAQTRLSGVDGLRGQLTIAGRDVADMATLPRFEIACAALCDGDDAQADAWAQRLGAARVEAFERLPAIGDALRAPDAIAALRAAAAHTWPDHEDWSDRAAALVGMVAVALGAWIRTRAGLAPVPPSADHAHAADILAMATGESPTVARERALTAYLSTVVDHGMNASTFAARVVASTHASLSACVVAGLAALEGPLHGGAPGPVLDMLDAVGSPDNAGAWIDAELAAGRRIMGIGHRVYRVRDPRAAALEGAYVALGADPDRRALARAVEEAAVAALARRHPERPLQANVEFFTALLLDALGFPREALSGVFAAARVVGWCAHAREQLQTGRLLRPRADYVGPAAR